MLYNTCVRTNLYRTTIECESSPLGIKYELVL